ncbi:MAG: NBR1-Ig-like domain-containing protein [Anaerolineaceae bacterium]|nr:NBR1-Ig-like domain-containing protein [Anaerolineaceae bacterium]
MKKNRLIIPIYLATILMLSSCDLTATSTPSSTTTPEPGFTATVLVQTIQALSTQNALLQPSATPITSLTPTPTQTESETETPAVTAVPTLTAIPTSAAVSSCNAATLESDVTIPAGTVLDGGASFVKTWRILNSGTCSWNTSYQLIYTSGNSFSAPAVIYLPGSVAPGQTIDISANMVAPNVLGTYQGYWEFRSDLGVVFGVGINKNVPISVQIVVGTTGVSFSVNHVDMDVSPGTANVSCPPGQSFSFSADISTNGAGNVSYYWAFSDGTKSVEKTINFTNASDQTVKISWELGNKGAESSNPFTGWARIYIDTPNHQYFNKQNITLNCTSSPAPSETPKPTPTS